MTEEGFRKRQNEFEEKLLALKNEIDASYAIYESILHIFNSFSWLEQDNVYQRGIWRTKKGNFFFDLRNQYIYGKTAYVKIFQIANSSERQIRVEDFLDQSTDDIRNDLLFHLDVFYPRD